MDHLQCPANWLTRCVSRGIDSYCDDFFVVPRNWWRSEELPSKKNLLFLSTMPILCRSSSSQQNSDGLMTLAVFLHSPLPLDGGDGQEKRYKIDWRTKKKVFVLFINKLIIIKTERGGVEPEERWRIKQLSGDYWVPFTIHSWARGKLRKKDEKEVRKNCLENILSDASLARSSRIFGDHQPLVLPCPYPHTRCLPSYSVGGGGGGGCRAREQGQ